MLTEFQIGSITRLYPEREIKASRLYWAPSNAATSRATGPTLSPSPNTWILFAPSSHFISPATQPEIFTHARSALWSGSHSLETELKYSGGARLGLSCITAFHRALSIPGTLGAVRIEPMKSIVTSTGQVLVSTIIACPWKVWL